MRSLYHRLHSSLYKLHIGATDFRLDSWTFRMRPIGWTETSVRNYHYTQRNNSEERSSHQDHCGLVNSEEVVAQYAMGAKERERERERGMQEGMRTGGDGLIKEQLTFLNEVRSGLADDLILWSVGTVRRVCPRIHISNPRVVLILLSNVMTMTLLQHVCKLNLVAYRGGSRDISLYID